MNALPPDPTSSSPAPAQDAGRDGGARARVLVVDDQPMNVVALYHALDPEYQVIQATSGARALEICRTAPPDIVLLDVVMPEPDGHEVCRRLKADPATRRIPVIFVTAQHEPADEARGLEVGAVDFLAKPVNTAVVRRRVKTHLELARTNALLADMNNHLELRIVERTRDLELALRRAEVASQAKSDFLTNVSHEIRTPMNSIIGLSHLALNAQPSPKLRDYLEKIEASGKHLLGLINSILDLSKLEAGKVDLENTSFRLEQVFDTVRSQLASAAQGKGLELVFSRDAQLVAPLRGDPFRIGQVLLNFVCNAVKFSFRGRILIDARGEQIDQRSCEFTVSVSDQGVGIAREQIALLFSPFQQIDSSTTRVFGGTGLGLAISRQMVELMGGSVGVESEPGQGSRFWFRLRLDWAQAGGSATDGGQDSPGEDPWSMAPAEIQELGLDGRVVLLVDDNPLNRMVAAEMLEEAGIHVTEAENGEVALARLCERRFDCVLMDVQMPVMDGLQATRAIRADPALAALPVIAMTANAMEDDRSECEHAGMNDFLSKPVMARRLFKTLARWVGPGAEGSGAVP